MNHAKTKMRAMPGRWRTLKFSEKVPAHPLRRKQFLIEKAIWAARSENYSFHYEVRCRFRNMFEEEYLAGLSEKLGCLVKLPVLNLFGDAPVVESFVDARLIALLKGLACLHLLSPWYWTEVGWDRFQEDWKLLPEPADLWISGNKPVDNLWITCGNRVDNLPTYPQVFSGVDRLMVKLSTACGKVADLPTRLSTA